MLFALFAQTTISTGTSGLETPPKADAATVEKITIGERAAQPKRDVREVAPVEQVAAAVARPEEQTEVLGIRIDNNATADNDGNEKSTRDSKKKIRGSHDRGWPSWHSSDRDTADSETTSEEIPESTPPDEDDDQVESKDDDPDDDPDTDDNADDEDSGKDSGSDKDSKETDVPTGADEQPEGDDEKQIVADEDSDDAPDEDAPETDDTDGDDGSVYPEA